MTPRRRTRKETILGVEARSIAAELGTSVHQVAGMARNLGIVPPRGLNPRYSIDETEAILRAFREKRFKHGLMEAFLKIRQAVRDRKKGWGWKAS